LKRFVFRRDIDCVHVTERIAVEKGAGFHIEREEKGQSAEFRWGEPIPPADALTDFFRETNMGEDSKPAKPLEEKQATAPDVEMANDEGGVPSEADQSDDTDAKGAPRR
jgi:hypothetical protein